MGMPNSITFEILEERKNYLILKQKMNTYRKNYWEKEIEALDRITKFTKLVLNNLPRKFIRVLFKINEEKKKEYENYTAEDNKKYEVKYYYEKYLNNYIKLDISFIQTDNYQYIKLEHKKYVKAESAWKRIDRFRLSLDVLEELLKKWKTVYKETDEIKN